MKLGNKFEWRINFLSHEIGKTYIILVLKSTNFYTIYIRFRSKTRKKTHYFNWQIDDNTRQMLIRASQEFSKWKSQKFTTPLVQVNSPPSRGLQKTAKETKPFRDKN
jgi:hypothetical protein